MELTQEHLELIIKNNMRIEELMRDYGEVKDCTNKMKAFMANADGMREKSCPKNIRKELGKQVLMWSIGITGGSLGIITAATNLIKMIK